MASVKSCADLTETAKIEGKGRHEYVFSCPSSLSLSFAVWLVDDYTQKEPLGDVRVMLDGEKITTVKALKNLSGYYTFSGLPEGTYTLSVKSEFYFSEERIVDTSSFANSKEPVAEIFLKPKPLYPFSDRTTLIRGLLVPLAPEPDLLAGITIKAISKSTGREILVIPDEKGEFILYFKEIINRKADIILEIKGEGIEKTLSILIEESQSTYTGVISIP
ncbi:MAG TPA: carboxypeptidase-like regulatory domain-containing protein [Methanosarcina sp.]|nr:carboxypeptidase-like regulatory domain-containing protein [Methanosarcina sp.]